MSVWFRKMIEKRKKKPTPLASGPVQSCSVCPALSLQEDSMSPPPSSSQSAMMKSIECSDHPRWLKQYDVCICHSQQDIHYVIQLVSYLEQQPQKLRCFLQQRDAAVGSAIPTELCQAVINSHCWVMLITQNFLQDPWCRYQMNQALAEAPITNGRTIPVVKDLDRAYYPKELRFMYYIRVTLDRESDFLQIKKAILLYLQDLASNDAFFSGSDSNLNSNSTSHLSSCSSDIHTDSNLSTEYTSSSDTQIEIGDSPEWSDSQLSSACICYSDMHTNSKRESNSHSHSECACKRVTERSSTRPHWNSQSGCGSHLSNESTSMSDGQKGINNTCSSREHRSDSC
ncbi:toll/interleukin-1 receptor domain-containing adapter protein [Microcaecilia unicolor]|uniref:Toll/interleukin-1 receptor domain-containing adapter protein n=1 Tax=Microcaecilia unicolor TaxID=1415580 RepID=A0A6P7YPG8_9AMPH|nr:toll/interleukin-1 receptor domain-containing adapter protein [Microcaecilia unicolor]XP_030065130.1 toll/interleukin-1 receptor domain-containing adapter protein [Microcaecilia unicolor]XP_030065131.1 toll/interleukin-1 receptor domain-containing adapter protein [Microcaecilia unicolor]